MSITNFHTRSMPPRRLHAVALLGALPLVGVAAFQVGLWLGAPYGDAVLGGRATTVDGVLAPPYRWAAAGPAPPSRPSPLGQTSSPRPRTSIGHESHEFTRPGSGHAVFGG